MQHHDVRLRPAGAMMGAMLLVLTVSAYAGAVDRPSNRHGAQAQALAWQPATKSAAVDSMTEVWSSGTATSVRELVASWSQRAGWQVRWAAASDPKLESPVSFRGSYRQAITALIKLYAHTATPLKVDAYQGGTPPVLIVTGFGAGRAHTAASVWAIRSDESLREIVTRWSATAGWTSYWDPSSISPATDYRIGVPQTFSGPFKTAVTSLFDALPQSVPLCAVLHEANRPPLVYVTQCGHANEAAK